MKFYDPLHGFDDDGYDEPDEDDFDEDEDDDEDFYEDDP